MIAPADVELDGADDDRTMVQPDIFIVCDRKKVTMERTVGCPDFIIEILSPSSRKKDTFIKQNKYRSAGAREYWTVDLRDELVTTYLYDAARVLQYRLDDKVPIGIYNGKIKVDFAEITAYVRDYLGDYRAGEMDPEEPEDDERA